MVRIFRVVLALMLFSLGLAYPAVVQADYSHSFRASQGSWRDAGNWDMNGIPDIPGYPDSQTDVDYQLDTPRIVPGTHCFLDSHDSPTHNRPAIISGLQVGADASLTITDGSVLFVYANPQIENNGAINLNSNSHFEAKDGATLNGSGTLTLNGAYLDGSIVNNSNITLNGGYLTGPSVNNSNINSNIKGTGFIISKLENNGFVWAKGGELWLDDVNNQGTGQLNAEGENSSLNFYSGSSVTGGSINLLDGGTANFNGTELKNIVLQLNGSSDGVFNCAGGTMQNVTLAGGLVNLNGSVSLKGTNTNKTTTNVNSITTFIKDDNGSQPKLINNGTVYVGSTGYAYFNMGEATEATFEGTGKVVLLPPKEGAAGPNSLSGPPSSKFINEAGHTIQGIGTITAGSLDNKGRIVAEGGFLDIKQTNIKNIIVQGTIPDQATLTASIGATLRLNGSSLSGGYLLPGEGKVELLNATISDVRLGPGDININQYVKFVNDFFIPNGSSIQIGSGSSLDLTEDTGSKKSIITNEGIIRVTSGPSAAIMAAFGTEVTLAGRGIVFLGGGQSLMTEQLGGSFINSAEHTISGAGTIDAPLKNLGTITTESGTLAVLREFQNEGSIKLRGGTFDIKGQQFTNRGWIDGQGELKMGAFINEEILIQRGGKLSIGDDVTNNGIITLQNTDVRLGGNLTNTKIINVTGGSFLMRGTLSNQESGKITLDSPQPAKIEGDVINKGHIYVNNCNLILSKPLDPEYEPFVFTNDGKVTVSNSTFEHPGTFQNNNAYISDPSTNIFGNLIVGENGYFQGGLGDRFIVQGDFINESIKNNLWNTENASLIFETGDDNHHKLFIAGTDLGGAGFENNFAWGDLDLSGQILELYDNDGTPGGALYVHKLIGATFSDNQVNNISGNGLNIFYDLSNPENAYLGGGQFKLGDGAYLIPVNPVPLPSTLLLMGSGLLGLGAMGWRRRRKG